MKRTVPLIGLLAALTLFALTLPGLGRQGAYYDELHQAPASFRYLGKTPQMFTYVANDILLLNTPYSGAIKSHLYGMYLWVRPQFTVYSWRLLGILFVVAGLLAFYGIAGKFMSLSAGLIFAALLLTDATVVLTTRFDWGPTALSLGIRLVFLGLWLSLEFGEDTPGKRFAAGLLVGLAVWEKLVAFTLLAPLLLMLFAGRGITRKALVATVAGGLLGSFPLAYANYSSYRHGNGLISLTRIDPSQAWRWADAQQYASEFLRLGHGETAGFHVLGVHSRPFWPQAELFLLVATLALIVFVILARWKQADSHAVVAAKMVAAYLSMGLLLFLMPQGTNIHHWIQATPFQYAAVALVLAGSWPRVARLSLAALVSLLLLVRIANLADVESAVIQGKASAGFDPVMTRLGEIAAARSQQAIFIAADWGTATQIYCFGNGDDELVYEPFWERDAARSTRVILEQAKKDTVYLVSTGMAPSLAEAAKAVTDAVATAPGWREFPIEPELSALTPLHIRKFERQR